ncbi:alpha-N-acetylglucosaminidase-like isoform X2 [Aristolochia californica]|uniref:alpha-N-acetylglucosaminidase-like isoform X2 n=1 Tax=Aristolochia californica TaxID=171875 RepID=UPI0035DE5763
MDFAFCLLIFLFYVLFISLSSETEASHLSRILEIHEREHAYPSVQIAAAHGVLHRLLPAHSSSFEFEIVSKEQCGGKSCFIISNHPSSTERGAPEILIGGVTAVEVLAGLHWYLKYWCGAHISWEKTGGAQLSSVPKPGLLPRLQTGDVLIQRPVAWNYYQNAVTSSYSFAWWDWERWEKEIDWMALQGINLPLAFNGQESIWQKVFQKFNMSASDLNDFFGGPAFLAWSRMGNLHGWGGPLPQSWFDHQLVMQKKILSRMFELGMTPEYGRSGHIYNCDTFDENTPPVDDPEYISSLGAAIYQAMRSGDDDAVWLMQGWLFSYDPFWEPPQMQALLHSVPIGRLVVLDLFAEVKPIWHSSEHFYGVPYIWCMLHNFAANIEMYGVLDSVASGPLEALGSKNSTMVGVGMCMEGIEQNPVVYDLMSEMAFRHDKIDLKVWVYEYTRRRYGTIVPNVQDAWEILHQTVYNCTDGSFDKNRDFIVAFPDVDPSFILIPKTSASGIKKHIVKQTSRISFSEGTFDWPHLWYPTSDVVRALELFLSSRTRFAKSQTFRYDLVDLTRQALAKYANQVFLKIIEFYQLDDINGASFYCQHFLELVNDIDTLLACHEGFLLGPWLESARNLATDSKQEKQFEWNARTQITMWYDNTEVEASSLRDYANKYWSGLLRDYYGPRAAIYFRYLLESMKRVERFPLEDWRREWIKFTNEWQSSRKLFQVKSSGDALNVSQWLYDKYLKDPVIGGSSTSFVA